MKNLKITILIFVVTTAAIASFYFYQNRHKEPSDIPDLSPRGGDANASVEYLNALHSVERLREEIKNHPGVVKNYVELAQIFLQEARVTGKHHEYIPKAQILLNDALKIDPNNFEAIITEASVQMTLHQFAKAKDLALRAIPFDQYNAFAYGVLVDADVELGLYPEAVKYCDKMLSLRPDLRSYARASYLRELYGETDASCKAMILATNSGMNGQEDRAWTLYNLGNLYLYQGKIDTAEFIFNGILQERPNYSFALSGLAEVDCVKKNYGEAIELLVKASQLNPNHLFLQQLADIYLTTGQKDAESEMDNQILQAFKIHQQDGYDIHYEYALFCANHNINLQEALNHAEKEYAIRPENIDALDTYAWALFKNGRSGEATPYIEKAMRLGTKRAVLLYHAAEIYHATGSNGKSLDMIKKCLKADGYVDTICRSNAISLYHTLQSYASLK
jgi:tetratricopeptide (TPR) repeat protein